jgi:hypothetical protein
LEVVKQGDIEAIYGYNKDTKRYAVRLDRAEELAWLEGDQFENTDPVWLQLARKQGMPASYTKNTHWPRPLKGGVLTRSQRKTLAADSTGVSVLPVPQQSPGLCCLSDSFCNLAHACLSEKQKTAVRGLQSSETLLAEILRRDNFPLRMGKPKLITGVPCQPGSYLVSLTPAHTDGLRVMEDGTLHFYPSDHDLSQFVLTHEHPYVIEHVCARSKKYQAIQLVQPTAELPHHVKKKQKQQTARASWFKRKKLRSV